MWVIESLTGAIRPVPGGGPFCHSDRGPQYVSIKGAERLAEASLEPSADSALKAPTIPGNRRPGIPTN